MDQGVADPGTGSSAFIFQLLLMVVLIIVNAFFAASEMALVSVDANRLRERRDEGDKRAHRILQLLEDPSHFLSMIQICITLAGFFNSASAATGLAGYWGNILAFIGVPSAKGVATITITILLSLLTIIFGELVPKRLALQNAENFSNQSIGILWWCSKLLKPFVYFLSWCTNGVLHLMGVEMDAMEEKVTLSDIKSLVQVGQSQGMINKDEGEMINSIISFDDKSAEDIMTPRTEVFAIDINDPYTDYIDELLTVRYSRIPVYDDEIDNIVGILYIKDYLQEAYSAGFENISVRKIMRHAYFVPERKNVNELFNEMREDNFHLAILIDEYGGFSGIVTMEDLLEEIVGDIDDEFDQDEPEIEKISRNTYYAKGTLSIKELNFNTDSNFDEETEDYDTLGGLLFFLMGRIPEDQERPFIEYQGMRFKIEKIENKRIQWVRIEFDPQAWKKEQLKRAAAQEER